VESFVPLDAVLTSEQQQMLADSLAEVRAHGYGRVTITIDHGHPALIETVTNKKLKPPVVQ